MMRIKKRRMKKRRIRKRKREEEVEQEDTDIDETKSYKMCTDPSQSYKCIPFS